MQGRLSTQSWVPRVLETARIGLQFVLLVLFAYLLAHICWLVIAPGDHVSTLTERPLPVPVEQASSGAIQADLSVLMTRNPFQASAAEAAEVPDAPETDLNLKLVALFMSTGGSTSSATIITPDNKTTRFELGDEILAGVTLDRVLSDRAIISRDGRSETLMRSGREAGLSVISDPDTAPNEPGRVTSEGPPLYEPGISARTLVAGLNAEPSQENGVTSALVLTPKGDPSLMQSAGLVPGDRLVSVNGRSVSALDPSALLSQLETRATVSIAVVRSGEDRTFEIRFAEG